MSMHDMQHFNYIILAVCTKFLIYFLINITFRHWQPIVFMVKLFLYKGVVRVFDARRVNIMAELQILSGSG